MHGLLTITDLCRITGQPAHIINHALRRYGPDPAGRVGIARVWNQSDVPALLHSLARTGAITDAVGKATGENMLPGVGGTTELRA